LRGGVRAAKAALWALERGQRADPSQFNVALRIVHARLRTGEPDLAATAAGRALRIEPHSPFAHVARARALLEAGKISEALDAVGTTRKLLNQFPAAMRIQIEGARKLGQTELAEASLRDLQALAKRDVQAQKLLQSLPK